MRDGFRDKTFCNMCGKEFDEWDKQEKFGFNYHVGYGSRHDLMHLQADLCCECFDKLMDDFIPSCKISPVLSEDYIDDYYEKIYTEERNGET